MRRSVGALLGVLATCAGCGAAAGEPGSALGAGARGDARIQLRELADRPRLTLVERDGDPASAVVATVVTDAPAGMTTALAALVEARVRAAGFDVDARVTRSAFRLRWSSRDGARLRAFFDAVARAFARPVAAGAAELEVVDQRVASLKRHRLDAPELASIAACTGALALAPGEPAPDVKSAAGVSALEAARIQALNGSHTSLGVVGGASFVEGAASALGSAAAWPAGSPIAAQAPPGESVGAYTASGLGRRSARLSIAVSIADPLRAVSAAEALGTEDGALMARLRALADPWRVQSVTGAARPNGGCVSVILETDAQSPAAAVEASAAVAAAVARKEIALAAARPADAGLAAREILDAADPRDAAARAGWWALATKGSDKQAWGIALGVAPNDKGGFPEGLDVRFRDRVAREVAAADAPVVERRVAVERGQGELWLLLASPCGVGDEGARDAGWSALATLAAVAQARRAAGGVHLEPWVTSDGIGVIAHAAAREAEAPGDLAVRVGDAAARALTTTPAGSDATLSARAALLERVERVDGRQGAAFEALANALSPNHPSWVAPFGIWSRLASGGAEAVRERAAALAGGPLRVAVLANTDATQSAAAAGAIDRWLAPSAGERVCRPGVAAPPHAGHATARLPSDATMAQAMIAAPMPESSRAYGEIAAELLGGDHGALAAALRDSAGSWSARVVGGVRNTALVVDVRAPDGAIVAATAQAKAALLELPQRASDADVAAANAALERSDTEASFDPRSRLTALWTSEKPRRPITAASLKANLAGWIRETAFVVVEARAD